MNSPTHALTALALLTKRGETDRNRAVFIGSLIPDLFIYVCWAWLTFVNGESQSRIWDEIYFDAPMQLTASIFNSIPLYAALAIGGYALIKRKYARVVMWLALAALIHIALDFPVHGHDAYAHFWPFSDWKFHSPFSYWEIEHHARWVSLIEAAIGMAAIVILWRRFPKRWVKAVLALFAGLYIFGQVMMQLAPGMAAG